MAITRRHLLQGTAAAALAPALGFTTNLSAIEAAHAQSEINGLEWRHALSLFGDVKYPADFKHFDYVNPNAPKGGVARMISIGTFDNFNLAVAGIKGSLAPAATLIYETLMAKSQDEVVDRIRPAGGSGSPSRGLFLGRSTASARRRAGTTASRSRPEDVIFSIDTLKQYSPMYGSYYRHVVKAEKVGEREIKFSFDGPGNRELPTIVGELPVLPKHCWEGTDSQGRKRDISQTTLEPPLGSGPYRIKEFVAGPLCRA